MPCQVPAPASSCTHAIQMNNDSALTSCYTHLAWQVLYAAFWNGEDVPAGIENGIKEKISQLLEQGPARRGYQEFVQRVLLWRQYNITHHLTAAIAPEDWLHDENQAGFGQTQEWFAHIERIRQTRPEYKAALKQLPDALFETVKSGSVVKYHEWRSWFAEAEAHSTLALYLSVMNNISNNRGVAY